jgi:hypothetical protein
MTNEVLSVGLLSQSKHDTLPVATSDDREWQRDCTKWAQSYECSCKRQDPSRRSRLRHCATSRKVAGSIPDGISFIFHWHNPSGRTMAPGLTQPLTEMSTRSISWGWSRPVRTADNLHVQTVLKSGSLNLLEPSGPVQGCNGIALSYLFHLLACKT